MVGLQLTKGTYSVYQMQIKKKSKNAQIIRECKVKVALIQDISHH